jgi:hypothetical protein
MAEVQTTKHSLVETAWNNRGARTREVSMPRQGNCQGPGPIVRLGLFFFMTGGMMVGRASAQEKKDTDKAASAFDDDKKPADDKKTGDAKDGAVSDRDTIGFSQQNAASQMNELEDRMFRLSEALRGLEPENASRLRLALKFSREEQILEQMRENFKLLKDAQLSKAETETKELIAKLEHLRNLLLAEDLDFQLKLARLRQMRETLAQLDRLVKEQRRAHGWSRFAIEQRKRLARLATRRGDLDTVLRDQEAIMADTKKVPKGRDAPTKGARSELAQREVQLRNATAALAADPLFADLQPPHLRRADAELARAVTGLEAADMTAALAAQDSALGKLRDELTRFKQEVAQTERTVAAAKFQRRALDQVQNRGAAETLESSSARLGDVGVALRKDLIRASASMRSAEQQLGKDQAPQAAELAKSRDDFARAIERLLVELRAELQTRLISDLTEMHEMQSSIRETTQAQVPRIAQKSRSALMTVGGLSKNEGQLGERTEHLLALVEETEYGIALPTTLRILSREMRSLEGWLKAGDVAPRTTVLETRVEEDLLGLVQAIIRRLSPATPPAPGATLSNEVRERERELNRLVAELKMVRMIQARLNDDTVTVDKSRAPAAPPAPALRRDVETLESTQEEIRDALAKISERLPSPLENP